MEAETLMAIIPAIPGMIQAGLAVWKDVVKPLLIQKGYNVTEELEQRMLALEEQKDYKEFIEKLEGINKEINQNINITQNHTGDNSPQIGIKTGQIDALVKNYYGTEEKQSDVKKN